MSTSVAHRGLPMIGRDPHELHRAATPLELLYDLTFVVAFGVAGNEAAHYFAEGHWRTGLIGFGFAMFAVIWAWIQNTWFASAYDTDDWIYRLLTMVQMVGVLVLALGLPPMFESIEHGRPRGQRRDGARLRDHARRAHRALASRRAPRRGPPSLRGHLRDHAADRPDRMDRAAAGRGVDRGHVLDRRRAHTHRGVRSDHRRAPLRRHPVARPPHRRALWAPDDHHARGGDPRHGRRDQRGRPRRRVDRRDSARRARRRRTRVRHVVDVLRHPERGAAAPLPQAVVRLGIRAPLLVRRPRRDRRRAPCELPCFSSTRRTSANWPSSSRPPCHSPPT